jgi:membrane associated rhomboid family serine protease
MALADRPYMREERHPPRLTTVLVGTLIAAFVVQSGLLFYWGLDVSRQLALTVGGLSHGKLWQLFSFQFLHLCPWPWHVLLNCLGLYFFGRPVEDAIGARRFLLLYLGSGVGGGLLQVLLTVWLPRHADIPVVGASAGVCGLIAFFCSRNPMQELTTWLYFLPITVRARYVLMFLGGFSAFGAFIPFDGIAHGAHLGGILVGITYARGGAFWTRLSRWNPVWNRRRKQKLVAAASVRGRPWREEGSGAPGEIGPEEFMSQRVDPILDKISAHGLQSLTERERKVLDAARRQMGRR